MPASIPASGIAQIVAEHGNELFAQGGCFLLVEQRRLVELDRLTGFDVIRDHIGEQLEHAHDLRLADVRGLWGNGAQGAEEAAVGQHDRHRNIAFQPIDLGRVMLVVERVAVDIVDHHRRPMIADFVADGRPDIQLAAGFQTEGDLVSHTASDPAIFGYARNRGEPHTRRLTHHIKDRGYDIDGTDRADIPGVIGAH